MLVALKSESTTALALITPLGIFANMVAVSVVCVALIDICNYYGRKCSTKMAKLK